MAKVANIPLGETKHKAAAVTGPAADAAIATIAAADVPAGTYRIYVKVGFGGVAGAINDFELRNGVTDIATPLVNPALANTVTDRVFDGLRLDGTALTVNAIAGHGTGVYLAEVQATRID